MSNQINNYINLLFDKKQKNLIKAKGTGVFSKAIIIAVLGNRSRSICFMSYRKVFSPSIFMALGHWSWMTRRIALPRS